MLSKSLSSLQWRHGEHDGVSKSPASPLFTQPFIQAQIRKKTSKLCVTSLCGGNSPLIGEFPAEMTSNAEKIAFKIIVTHCNDVIMSAMPSQITSSASLVFLRGIHRWPANSPHKGPVTRKMFLFDDVIMTTPKSLQMKIALWKGLKSISMIIYSVRNVFFLLCFITSNLPMSLGVRFLYCYYCNLILVLVPGNWPWRKWIKLIWT